MMALFILAVVIVAMAAVYAGWLPFLWALGIVLLVLLFAAWRLDRSRGARTAVRDPNRPDFYGQSSDSSWDVPTPYIDHPDGGGTPPGVERPGDVRPRRR